MASERSALPTASVCSRAWLPAAAAAAAGLTGLDGKPIGTFATPTVAIDGDGMIWENLTLANTAGPVVQALALCVAGDRSVFRRCRFLGWQDTLRADSPREGPAARQYFAECYIEGHVDFIYAAGVAVFDRCHVHAKADGFLTAASTPEKAPFGYVFLDCKITAGPDVEKGFYLGRPWRPYAATAFLRCELPDKLIRAGWHNWGKVENEQTARYAEYKNTGPGADISQRAPWARQLTDTEAAAYSVRNVLGGADGWNPSR